VGPAHSIFFAWGPLPTKIKVICAFRSAIITVLLLEIQVKLFKDYMSFFKTKLVITTSLTNSIEILSDAHIDKLNGLFLRNVV